MRNASGTSRQLVYAVISRQVDATFAYSILETGIKAAFPKANIFFGPELWRVPIGLMVREDSVTTRTALNGALARYLGSNSYAFLSQQYFKEDVRCRS